eukprot:TRINITY_DN1367_c1_g1_i1.p1 TRINITY_DN1367_c1_g1~~TRINITY_DN1367_c1_g1_i1.p1  ORF type:complete len:554 (+),score=116.26 TRINITY_DN1367_c1_g1_i1:96-1757(+)
MRSGLAGGREGLFGGEADGAGRPRNVILLGPPASGKGTQAEFLSRQYGMVPISTGDLLRARKKFLPEIAEYMESGRLVPDAVVSAVLRERLAEADCVERGVLLDGFPRTRAQAEALRAAGVEIAVVVHLDVADDVVIERIAGRRIDPLSGRIYHTRWNPPPPEAASRVIRREDDDEDKIRTRLVTYHEERDALLSFYVDRIVTVHVGTAGLDALPEDATPPMVSELLRRRLEGNAYYGSVIRSRYAPKVYECTNHAVSLQSIANFFEHSRYRLLQSGCLQEAAAKAARIVVHAQMLHLEECLAVLQEYEMCAWLEHVGDYSVVLGHSMSRACGGAESSASSDVKEVALGSAAVTFLDAHGQRLAIPGVERLRQLVTPSAPARWHWPLLDSRPVSPATLCAPVGPAPADAWRLPPTAVAAVDLDATGWASQAFYVRHFQRAAAAAAAAGGYPTEVCHCVLRGRPWRAYLSTFPAAFGDRLDTVTWEVDAARVEGLRAQLPDGAVCVAFRVRRSEGVGDSSAALVSRSQSLASIADRELHGCLVFVVEGTRVARL